MFQCVSVQQNIFHTISFPWNYQKMTKAELKRKVAKLAERYSKDVSHEDHVQEINHITIVHNANLGRKQLGVLELLNALAEYSRLESILPYLSVSWRMLPRPPVTVASAETKLSKLKLTKNYLRCTMGQDHLNNLDRLSIHSYIAKQIDSDTVICSFTKK